MSAAPKLCEMPFPWEEIRRRPAKRAPKAKTPPFDAVQTQAVGEALFGTCKGCGALLDVDGTCRFASTHPAHECPSCGAHNSEPITQSAPCLFCKSEGA